MKYNLIKLIRNTQDQYVATIDTYSEFKNARTNYFSSLTAFSNADDVKIVVVKIEDEFGHELAGYTEQIEHEVKTEETETE